jgi:hypothetical protein
VGQHTFLRVSDGSCTPADQCTAAPVDDSRSTTDLPKTPLLELVEPMRRSPVVRQLVVAAAILLAAPGVAAPATASTSTVTVPRSIDATGRSDVTTALHEFLAHVPNGSTIVFPAHARYRIEGTLRLRDRHDLTFVGNGATVFATTRGGYDRSQWYFVRGYDIVFRNLVVRGANARGGMADDAYNPKLEAQHGFRFEGTQHVLLDHVTVTNVYGDFVYLGKDFDTRVWSQHVVIEHSTFARNGRQGISVIAARYVTIAYNTITDTRRAVVDLEPNTPSWGADYVVIANNTVGPGRLYFVAAHGNGPVNHVTIAGNVMRGHLLNIDVVAPRGTRRTNWLIAGNRSDKPAHQRVIRLLGVNQVTVQNNTQRVSTHGESGIVLAGGCQYHVSGNNLLYGSVSMSPSACR